MNAACIPYKPTVCIGQVLRFRLFANTCIRKDGHAIGLVRQDEQVAWLKKRGERSGFVVGNVRVANRSKAVFISNKDRRHQFMIAGAQFDGFLTVNDVDAFLLALYSGVGREKSLGFGLLSVVNTSCPCV